MSNEPIDGDSLHSANKSSVLDQGVSQREIHEYKRTCCDTETSEEVIPGGPDSSLELQGNPERLDDAQKGDSKDEGDIQPIDMLVPVGTGDGSIGDMDLFGVANPRAGSICRLGRHDGSAWLRTMSGVVEVRHSVTREG